MSTLVYSVVSAGTLNLPLLLIPLGPAASLSLVLIHTLLFGVTHIL